MAAITAINLTSINDFIDAPETTLTASDTLTFQPTRTQILLVTSVTGGTLLIDGDGGTSINVPQIGSVNVATGKSIVIPANGSKIITLSTIAAYCQGTVTLSGATGAKVRLIELGGV